VANLELLGQTFKVGNAPDHLAPIHFRP
jgi:hypothetical protein